MTGLLVIAGEGDPTTELLVEAGRRLGVETRLVDLRRDRLSVRVGGDRPAVLVGSDRLDPDVVVNTTSVNSLGLAGADGLLRQRSTRWRHRHAAAKEEQGVLLAALGLLRDQGAVLASGSEAADLALMPNVVIDRLGRAGLAVDQAAKGHSVTDLLVAGGRGIQYTGDQPRSIHVETALSVATAAQFELGAIRMIRRESGPVVVTGWDHRIDLSGWSRPESCATEILRSFPALQGTEITHAPSAFLVEDLADS